MDAFREAEDDDHAAERDDRRRAVERTADPEHGHRRDREERGRQGERTKTVVPAEGLRDRQLGDDQGERVHEEDDADPGRAHACVLVHVRRQDGRDRGIGRRNQHRREGEQPDEGAVVHDPPEAARDHSGCGTYVRDEEEQADERQERARVHREEDAEADRHARGRDQPADEAADAEAEIVGHAREGVGGRALLARGERGEQARVARREAAVAGARDHGERECLPRVSHEREAAVACREQGEGAHQGRPRADPVDDAAGERAADDSDPEQARDDDAGDPEAEVADVV